MDSIIYQVSHPWHWLAYGNNATALTCLMSIVTATAVIWYTRDQSRIRLLQEESRRLAEEPVLIVDFPTSHVSLHKIFALHNYGRGMALHVQSWLVRDHAVEKFGKFVKGEEGCEVLASGDVPPQASRSFGFDITQGTGNSALVVTICFDRFGRWHQAHVLYNGDEVRATFFAEHLRDYRKRAAKPEFRWYEA